MFAILILLALINPRLEDAGTAKLQAWVQVGSGDRHFDMTVSFPHQCLRWHLWKGDEGCTFGHQWADGSCIAYGYWPDCRWNNIPRNNLPVPYCGCSQAKVASPY